MGSEAGPIRPGRTKFTVEKAPEQAAFQAVEVGLPNAA